MKKLEETVDKIDDLFRDWNQKDDGLREFTEETLKVFKKLEARVSELEVKIKQLLENNHAETY